MFSSTRGNALFIILIAVALFAALSYAVTQSGRSSGTISREQAALQAAQIYNYAALLQSTVDRVRLRNGLQAWQLYFNQDVSKRQDGSGVESTIGTPTDPGPYIFHPNGGGITAQVFTSDATPSGTLVDWVPGHTAVRQGTLPGQGTNLSDIILITGRLSMAVCDQLNIKAGITTSTASIVITHGSLTQTTAPTVMADWTGPAASLASISGQQDFCMTYSGGAYGVYVHVLAAY